MSWHEKFQEIPCCTDSGLSLSKCVSEQPMETVLDSAHVRSILIADDHAMIRDAVCQELNGLDGLAVTAVGDFPSVLACLQGPDTIDLLLLDVVMPGMKGLESLRQLLEVRPDVRIVLFSGNITDDIVLDALAIGARGYVSKTMPLRSLRAALQLVLSGQVFLPMSILEQARADKGRDPVQDKDKLTSRELSVLRLVADGATNTAIAATLNMTEVTVKLCLRAIFTKLQASNRTRAVILAKEKMLL